MKLKAYHSILIFAILVISAAFSSVSNYRKAQYAIVQDMNKALALTLQENKYQWIKRASFSRCCTFTLCSMDSYESTVPFCQ